MTRVNADCRKTRGLLEDYYEETLSERQHERVAAHLARCPACAAELTQIEKLVAVLEVTPSVEPNAEIVRAISVRIAALPTPLERRRIRAGWRRLGVIGACATALLTILSYLLSLIFPTLTAASMPIWGFALKTGTAGGAMLAAGYEAVAALLPAIGDLLQAGWLALPTIAPTIAAYAITQMALLVAAVLICRHRRTSIPVSLVSLV